MEQRGPENYTPDKTKVMMKCVIPFFLSDGLDLQYWRKCY